MIQIVKELNFEGRKGMLYAINKDGELIETKPGTKGSGRVILSIGIEGEKGYLYFLNSEGNVSWKKMRNSNFKNKRT